MAEARGLAPHGTEDDWTPPADRRRWAEGDGRAMAEAFWRSEEGPAQFARRHGIGEWRVRRWAEKFPPSTATTTSAAASPVSPGVFAPVRIVPAARDPGAGAGGATLDVMVGGAVIRVRAGFDEDLLQRVAAALRGAGC